MNNVTYYTLSIEDWEWVDGQRVVVSYSVNEKTEDRDFSDSQKEAFQRMIQNSSRAFLNRSDAEAEKVQLEENLK